MKLLTFKKCAQKIEIISDHYEITFKYINSEMWCKNVYSFFDVPNVFTRFRFNF